MSVKRFDQFEQNIKEALNNIEPQPDQSVWKGIKGDLASSSTNSGFSWKAAAIGSITTLAVAGGVWLGLNSLESDNKLAQEETKTAQKAPGEEKASAPAEHKQGSDLGESTDEISNTSSEPSKGEAKGNDSSNESNSFRDNAIALAWIDSDKDDEELTTSQGSTSEGEGEGEGEVEKAMAAKVQATEFEKMVEVSETEVCQGKAIECRTLNGKSAIWDMGDGNRLEGYRIMYHYLSSGSFKIQAYQEDETGELAAIGEEVPVMVYNKPNSEFEVYAATEPGDAATRFSAHETNGKHIWRFGNGKVSEGASTEHRYRNKGFYQVKHISISPDGCADSSVQNIKVHTSYNLFASTVFNPTTDTWLPKGLREEGIKFQLKVFDINGGMAFTSSNPDQSWDGRTQSGRDVKEGDIFYWVAIVTDMEGETVEYGGNILIISR